MAEAANHEIERAEWINSLGQSCLGLASAGWIIAAVSASGPLAWGAGMAFLLCAYTALSGASVITPADTARRWFRRRLGLELSYAEAMRYGPVFCGRVKVAEHLEQVLRLPRDDAIVQMRLHANGAAQALNMEPPFPDEARAQLRRQADARERRERTEDRSEKTDQETDSRNHEGHNFGAGGWGTGQRHQQQYQQRFHHDQSAAHSQPTTASVNVALSALGLGSMPASQEALKRAWRSRLSEYHPDKFAQAPKQVQQMANEVALQANRAYAELCRSQGWRP